MNISSNVRVIVWDRPGTTHALKVKKAVVSGYGMEKNISGEVEIINSWNDIENILNDPLSNIECIVRPYADLTTTRVILAQRFYPKVLFFQALRDNKFRQVFTFDKPSPPVVCVCGAGDAEERNNTSWGNGLEFWDRDWTWDLGGDDAASFSMGFIC